MTYIAILTGDTFQFRARIKDAGWKWDAERKAWTKPIDDEDYAAGPDRCRHRYVNSIPGVGNRGRDIALAFEAVAQ